jgi:hypothetical protein
VKIPWNRRYDSVSNSIKSGRDLLQVIFDKKIPDLRIGIWSCFISDLKGKSNIYELSSTNPLW